MKPKSTLRSFFPADSSVDLVSSCSSSAAVAERADVSVIQSFGESVKNQRKASAKQPILSLCHRNTEPQATETPKHCPLTPRVSMLRAHNLFIRISRRWRQVGAPRPSRPTGFRISTSSLASRVSMLCAQPLPLLLRLEVLRLYPLLTRHFFSSLQSTISLASPISPLKTEH